MSLVTIKTDTLTVAVIRGTIERPLVGVWTADLVIDQPDGTGFESGTKVTISSPDYADLVGIVAPGRTGDFVDAVHVRVLGGAGGMPKTVQPRNYIQPQAFARDVLNGLCQDSGETLSSTVDASFLGTNLAAWSVKGEPTSYALRTLLDIVSPTFNWRILADGTLWMGAETWPTATVAYELISQDPAEATWELGLEAPAIEPGTTIDGVGKVSRVHIDIMQSAIRAKVWTPVEDEVRGPDADLEALINQKISHVDYYATYICQVQGQSADLTTVDISPVGARNQSLLGGFQRVPVRFLTGIKIQVAQGSSVLLAWDGGNPEQPYALAGLSGDTAQSIQLAGNTPVARKGDTVNIGSFNILGGVSTAFTGIAWTPPGGGTPVTFSIANVPPIGPGTELTAKISGGSTIVGSG